jgi:hypothetical protein
MATLKFNWSFSSQIDPGPQFSASQPSVDVTGFDHEKQIIAAKGSADIGVNTSNAKVVLILADDYDAKVTYDIDKPAATRTLDAPHILLGPGAVAFIGTTATKLTFKNPVASAVTVQIFIGS